MDKNQKTNFMFTITLFVVISFVSNVFSQNQMDSTVTDFDGNVYQTVTIGNQEWLKENLKSLHYADGTSIPNVVAFNNSDSMAQIYGRLYTWNATIRDSASGTVKGVCPCGWHVPTHAEWQEMENYLGGAAVAGGKMKETGTAHWSNPNTGATNSSGFSGLPAGEWDPNNTPNYRLLNEYAVFWTATSVSSSKARERYLAYNNTASTTFDWFKNLKYSIRCVKDQSATNIDLEKGNSELPKSFELIKNYPNPFNPSTTISYILNKKMYVKLDIFNLSGRKIQSLVNQNQSSGDYKVTFYAYNLPSGIYYYQFQADDVKEIGQMVFLK